MCVFSVLMMPAYELARHLVEGLFLDWHSQTVHFELVSFASQASKAF